MGTLQLKAENERLKKELGNMTDAYANLLLDVSSQYSGEEFPEETDTDTVTDEIMKKLDAKYAKKISRNVFLFSVVFVVFASILLYL